MSRSAEAPAPAVRFRRAAEDRPVRKPGRGLPVRIRQFLVLCLLAGAAFFALTQIILFVLSWKKLEIRDVQVRSSDPAVQATAERMAGELVRGNILALDAAGLQKRFKADPWIKEIRIRKILPAAVRIEIEPRVPVAVLEAESPVLIDAEGVTLDPARPDDRARWPRFTDEDLFRSDAAEKIKRGWACLRELGPEERADVEILDLTAPAGADLKFRSSPIRFKLGDGEFGVKIALLREKRSRWEREFGAIEYLDLRFPDRIYVKAAPPAKPPAGTSAGKEIR